LDMHTVVLDVVSGIVGRQVKFYDFEESCLIKIKLVTTF